jgi:hypothetical protein
MEMANALPEAGRKPTNLSLNTALVAEEQGRRWKQENPRAWLPGTPGPKAENFRCAAIASFDAPVLKRQF